jgi:hypothetical protein
VLRFAGVPHVGSKGIRACRHPKRAARRLAHDRTLS